MVLRRKYFVWCCCVVHFHNVSVLEGLIRLISRLIFQEKKKIPMDIIVIKLNFAHNHTAYSSRKNKTFLSFRR